ncbi:TonB-dependent receptor [Pseudoduganella sp. DS3]|uniref:TonB-dependent receptor n=1 Tax=Pseudoduganella guangdongensis TaxID=2692179 RepID=A0A6N9HBA7_9BURK|nr:TonB-dependent receptor [Pseudoduganella guangdongensis]MYN00507.1 TonB-dependent receptor [Pseudoduganella guangdongensis]
MKNTALMLAAALAGQAASAQPVVEIKTARIDQRKDDTASTLVLTRDELAANGDRTLADALRRLPGITISDTAGIKMRGLGNGYTQVLLNGQTAPQGFALDSLPPEVVERVEVLRTASAILGTQGIAGTINIVLRKTIRRSTQEAQLGLDGLHGTWSPRLSAQSSGKADGWSHSVSVVLARPSTPADRIIADSEPGLLRLTRSHEDNTARTLNLAPRLNWSSAGGDQFSLQSLATLTRRVISYRSSEEVRLGESGDFADVGSRFAVRSYLLRSELAWQRKLASNAQWELKLGASTAPRDTGFDFTGMPLGGAGPTTRHVDGDIREHGFNHGGKYAHPFGNGHALVAGWDGSAIQRMQSRVEHEYSHSGALNFLRDDRYDGRIERLAAFAQDEWKNGSDAWSAGLRWETMRTEAHGRNTAAVRQRSTVVSPVLEWMRQLPGGSQWRLGASRSYKAPNMLDLIPRRFTADNNNSATNPDTQGNPTLRPELAWGLDAGIDYYWAKDSLLSASVYARDIDNVILTTLYREGQRWIAMPANHGGARSYGLSLEARMPLTPALALRANATFNHSRLDRVPGPDNRLDRQAPMSGVAALNYKHGALSLDAEYSYEAGGLSRESEISSTLSPYQRKLDLRASWKPAPRQEWRIALSDVLHPDRTTAYHYNDGASGTRRQSAITTRGGTTVRLNYTHAFE